MASIGKFGEVGEDRGDGPAEVDTFEWYGQEFTVPDKVPWVFIGEFSEAADSEGPEAFSAGMRMIRGVIGKQQWPAFRDLAAEHCSSFEDLMGPCMKIIEVVSVRPTQAPSASSDGSTDTPGSLKALSSSAGSSTLSPIEQREPRLAELKLVGEVGAELAQAL